MSFVHSLGEEHYRIDGIFGGRDRGLTGRHSPHTLEYCDIWYGPKQSEKKGILRAIEVPRLFDCSQ